ncbi:acyltransferase family protein [Cryobacterium arcticum]|uniref:acyltransferase family protein n=1 Tax=Cryobacterium arcticum TaxID=670052 RepID=UPI0008330C2D|nr:acyltransferase family protein [Cryobacterium arcticum]
MEPKHTKEARRADIQGLRAIAVLLVVADHLLGKPVGGFIGVDIFFVISGYLITGLLLREYARTGRISFADFYRRRLKRTVPAAFLAICATVGAGYFVLTSYQFGQLLQDAGWSFGFVSNWRFISVGTDYLHAGDAVSALQHFWSLAVEEQFYFVWPALLVTILLVARWRRWSPQKAVGIGIAVVAIVSFAWSSYETSSSPTSAYFATPSRVWELAVGGVLAALATQTSKVPAVWRTPMSWVGIGVIGIAALRINTESAFPAPWAILPVLGAALILVAGEGHVVRDVYPLTNPISMYVGKISYSLYLWHYPVIILGAKLFPDRGILFLTLSGILMLLLSVFSYHWVEEPLRTRAWRASARSGKFQRPTRVSLSRSLRLLTAVALVAAAMVIARPTPSVSAANLGILGSKAPMSAVEATRAAAVSAALTSTAWPELTPDPSLLGDKGFVSEWIKDGCLHGGADISDQQNVEFAEHCIYGNPNGAHVAVLFGDSIGISYLPALREALPDWRIEVLTIGQCPAVFTSVVLGGGAPYPVCDQYRKWAVARIAGIDPDLVVTASSTLSIERLASGLRGPAGYAEWQVGTQDMVKALSASAARVVVLDPPPLARSPQSCATRLTTPQDCVAGVTTDFVGVANAQRAGVDAVNAMNVIYPKTLGWFCSDAGLCPPYIGTTSVLADGMHLTERGSRELAPLLKPYLVGPE